jgi:hypothetical protein
MSKRKSLIGNDSSTHRRALFLTLGQERFAGLQAKREFELASVALSALA